MQGNGASESWLPSIPDLDGQARQAPRAGMRDALDAAACANGVVGQRIRLSAAAILRQPPFVQPQMQIQGRDGQALDAACHGRSNNTLARQSIGTLPR
jgi:hypothetical protein